MSWVRMFGSRLAALFRKGHGEENLDAELRAHLDALTEENIRRGMSPEEVAPIERDEFMLGASYVDFRKEPGPFEAITSMAPGSTACDVTEPSPVRLSCAFVEQTFLPTLGVQPILGPSPSSPRGYRRAAPRVWIPWLRRDMNSFCYRF